MFDEKDMNRADTLGQCFREIGGEMLPPPDLVKAAKAGIPYRTRVRTATHVKKFTKAVLAYVVGIALFLSLIFLLPRLRSGGDPVGSDSHIGRTSKPTVTTPVQTTPPAITTSDDTAVPDPIEPTFTEFLTECGITAEELIQGTVPDALTDFMNLHEVQAFIAKGLYYSSMSDEGMQFSLFAYGLPARAPTAAEREALSGTVSSTKLDWDVYCFTQAEITALIETYAVGTPYWMETLDEELAYRWNGCYYLEQTDAYYIFTNYTQSVLPENLQLYRTGTDGVVIVTFDNALSETYGATVLKEDGDSYRVIAHGTFEEPIEFSPIPPVTENDPVTPPVVTVPALPAFDSVNSIPKADKSDVGKTVTLSLQNKCFYYYYSPDDSAPAERIITVELVEGENYGKLVMYRPALGGLDSLCDHLNEPIKAEIVAVAHITLAEALEAFVGTDALEKLNADEIVNPDALTENPNYEHWYFSVNEGTAQNIGKITALAGNQSQNKSAERAYHTYLIVSILGRYDLSRHLYGDPVPPGTLPDAASIPKAEQTDVGKTVSLTLGEKTFYYFIDTESGKERLFVVENVEFSTNLGKITVYETALGGLDGLIAALDTAVNAKILAVSNISREEYNYAYTRQGVLDDYIGLGKLSRDEIVELSAPTENPHTAQWYCSVQESQKVVALLGNLTDTGSEYLQNRFDRIDSIIYRFDLASYLG